MDGRVGAPPERTPRVLVVDDCETSLRFQEYILSGSYQVLKARDGEEALRLAANRPVDLILLDLGLPGLGGLKVLCRLREADPDGRVPVIVLTVRGDAETEALARKRGCAGYLTKPVALGDLLREVRLHLRN